MSRVHASSTSLRLCRFLPGVAPGCGKSRLPATLLLLVVTAVALLQCHWRPAEKGARGLEKEREDRVSGRERQACIAGRSMVSQREILQIASRGENIKVGKSTEVHIMSAIHRNDYPTPDKPNIVLIAWVDQRRNKQNFVCCFTNSSRSSDDDIIQVRAQRLFVDERIPAVPMRYALFACTPDQDLRLNSTSEADKHFPQIYLKYVAFSEKTCQKDMTLTAHKIIKPEKVGEISRSKSAARTNFAVCLKVAYGELSPPSLVEWFEFAKIIGVAVVHVYYHIINEAAMTVFRYYEDTGFAVLSPVTPAVLKGHPPRGFQRPRWEKQAWMDGAVVCNDCLHRLHRYPFIAILDFDELLVPLPPYQTLPEVMQVTQRAYPQAGAFFIDSYIVVLDWPVSDNTTSVSFLRHLDRTVSNRLDNSGYGKSSPKVIVLPNRVMAVSTHDFIAKGSYTGRHVPQDRLAFLHYRGCKQDKWNGCGFERTRDHSLLRFKSRWLQAISQRPLIRLGCGRHYARAVRTEAMLADVLSNSSTLKP